MWADDKSASWWGIWYGLSHCGQCHALSNLSTCPQCGYAPKPEQITVTDADGNIREICQMATQGAISWSTNVLLLLMKREWERPPIELEADYFSYNPIEKRPSQRLMIVILFWTLFEHLMDRFFDAATSSLPHGVSNDLLRRYANIGSRMDRLYKIIFKTTLREDLASLGYAHVYAHLMKVQERRNRFVHGEAETIDEGLVYETVEKLQEVQTAWVALYNKRCTGNPQAPPVWEGSSPF